jgi:hypothetical protein
MREYHLVGDSFHTMLHSNPALGPGRYQGSIEYRACYDATDVCAQPVEGSPWKLPYDLTVVEP